jgi:hypothetical protein
MMKHFLFLFSLVISITNLLAQTEPHHEIAIDAAPLFRISNGFTIMYRYHLNQFSARAQANIYFENSSNDAVNNTSTPIGSNSNSFTSTSTNILNTELRLGLQRNYIVEKWIFYIGADVLFGTSNNDTKSETKNPASYGTTRYVITTNTSSTSYGLAPVLGISYKINKHFVLSIENSFAFTYAQNSSSQKNEYYFTPVNGVEALNNTDYISSSGSSTKFDFSPAKYLRLFVGFKF